MMRKRFEGLPERVALVETAAECVTMAEYIEQVVRKTQSQLAQEIFGDVAAQSRISALCAGRLPRPNLWPRYCAALCAQGKEALSERQFFRLMGNSARITQAVRGAARALQTPANQTLQAFEIVPGVEGAIVRVPRLLALPAPGTNANESGAGRQAEAV